MNTEQAYYENDDFWSGSLDNPVDRDRIERLTTMIPADVESLLDVGCGDGMFVHYLQAKLPGLRRIHAVDRSTTALRRVRTDKSQASIHELAFAPQSFHLVSSLEVIEHLPVPVMEQGLAKLAATAERYILISVPYLEDLDRSLIMCPSCRTRFNPDYHMRNFDDARMRDLLVPHGFRMKTLAHLGQSVRYRLLHKALNPALPIEKRPNPFPTSFPCPVCAFYLPKSETTPAAPHSPADAPARCGWSPREWIKKLWPKETRYRWVAALYERETTEA